MNWPKGQIDNLKNFKNCVVMTMSTPTYDCCSQGNVISFNSREEIVDFVASLLVAEFDCDVQTPELGQRISWNM